MNLMNKAGHISIDDLFLEIKKHFASISLATLYKNVHALSESNIIREVKIAGHKAKYEIEKEAHIHYFCKSCSMLKDIPFEEHTLLASLPKLQHEQYEDISIILSGICSNCRS